MDTLLKKLEFELLSYNNNFPTVTYDDIINLFETFLNRLKKLKPIEIKEFLNEYTVIIIAIKFEMQRFIDSCSNENKKFVIRLRDQIFGSKLKDITYEDPRRKVTLIVNEFLKGITWFQNEVIYNDYDPVYHRTGSCSRKGEGNHNCVGVTDRTTRKSNKRSIEKCYIERLIYDNIWQRINQNQQDEAHLKWLLDTKKAYMTCYPNNSIEIIVNYNDDKFVNQLINKYNIDINIPISITIKKFKDQNQIDEESYYKSYNNNVKEYLTSVVAIRYKDGKTYTKRISFLKNKLWLLPKNKN